MTEDFFEQSTDQSRVKAAIVADYFWAWAKVIIPTAKKSRKPHKTLGKTKKRREGGSQRFLLTAVSAGVR